MLKDTQREKALSNNAEELTKRMNMDMGVVGILSSLFIKVSYAQMKFTKNKVVFLDFVISIHFVHPILFALTCTYDRAILYRNFVFSIQ